jgi:hypothetical protein
MPILGIIASSRLAAVPPSYESIETVTVGGGGATDITFSSIPATYTHLQIRYMCLPSSGGATDLKMNFNSDTASNYSYHALYGSGAVAGATAGTSTTKIIAGVNGVGNSTYSTMFSVGIIDILEYANTNIYKTTRTLNGFDTNNATTDINNETIAFTSGNWRSTSAITSIVLAPNAAVNFIQYSHFALYGIKGA